MRRTAERLRGPLRAAGGASGALHAVDCRQGVFAIMHAHACTSLACTLHVESIIDRRPLQSCRFWNSCNGEPRMRG